MPAKKVTRPKRVADVDESRIKQRCPKCGEVGFGIQRTRTPASAIVPARKLSVGRSRACAQCRFRELTLEVLAPYLKKIEAKAARYDEMMHDIARHKSDEDDS